MIDRRTWYMLAALVAAVAAAIWWNQTSDQRAEPSPTPGPAPLWQLAPETVQEIEVVDLQTELRVHARRDVDVGWRLLQPEVEEGAADSGRLERAVTALLVPRPLSVLREVQPADFGLDPPMFQATLTLQDGSSRQIVIGRTAPTGDVAYVSRPGETAVYLLPASAVAEVTALVENFPLITPTTDAGDEGTPAADED